MWQSYYGMNSSCSTFICRWIGFHLISYEIHWCHKSRCHRVISCHHFFPLGDIDLICGIWVHSDQLQIKFTFRSGPMIFGILQTWHTHLWHQHIFDMTLTFVYFTWHLYLWLLLTYLKNTDVMNVNVMWKIHWCHKCICHVWKKHWCRHVCPMIFGRVISCHHFIQLRDIDLICGIWVHSDQLQIKFTFRSGPMIFGILQTWHIHLTLYVPATCVRSYC
jgi:hypothetical protein